MHLSIQAALLAAILVYVAAVATRDIVAALRPDPAPADEPLEAKRVRVYTKPLPDGTDDTIEGTLTGVRAGHYVLIHAELLEAPGADGTPLEGEVWLPTENVRTIQVLKLT